MLARAEHNERHLCGSCAFEGKSLSGLERHRNYHGHRVCMDNATRRRRASSQRKRRRLAEEDEGIVNAPQTYYVSGDDNEVEDNTDGEESEDTDTGEEVHKHDDGEESEEDVEEEELNYDTLEKGAEMYSSKFLMQQLNFRPADLTPGEKACLQFAAFSTRVGLSNIQGEALLAVLKSGLDVSNLPKTQRTLDKTVAEALRKTQMFTCGSEDGQQEKVIDVSSLNPSLPLVRFHFRDPIVAALELLTSVYQVNEDEAPVKLNWNYSETKHPKTGERVFKGTSCVSYRASYRPQLCISRLMSSCVGDHTGDWWRHMQETYLMRGCRPLVLKFFSDGTQTGASRSRCPVVMTVANLPAALQSSDRGKTCIGYIPLIKGLGATVDNLGKARKKIFHEVPVFVCARIWLLSNRHLSARTQCMKAVGETVCKANSQPITLMLDGEIVKLQVWVKNLIYDGPEARKAALVLSACTECLATRKDFALPNSDSLMAARTTSDMRAHFMLQENMIADKVHARCYLHHLLWLYVSCMLCFAYFPCR